jgi:hypothetical protein
MTAEPSPTTCLENGWLSAADSKAAAPWPPSVSAFAALGTWPSEDSFTSAPPTRPLRMSLPVSELFLTSLLRSELFLTSPLFTPLLPGRAIAEPDSAARSATNAMASAGDGLRERSFLIIHPSWLEGSYGAQLNTGRGEKLGFREN